MTSAGTSETAKQSEPVVTTESADRLAQTVDAAQPELIVETQGLSHRYGKVIALNNLNLQVPRGAIYGFVGPNGAGKTTTMRILTTLLRPDAGEARVLGYSVVHHRQTVRRLVGFMPDFFGVYENLRSWEYLDFFATAFGIPRRRRPALIDELLELVGLSHKRNEYVMGLSRGMKQRLSLARAMVHNPPLLVLDEPASGLDPRARVELRELLRELRAMEKTILISSHILMELAEICTHIAIIANGTLVAAGEVGTILRSLHHHTTIEVALLGDLEAAATIARSQPEVLEVHLIPEPPQLRIDYSGDERGMSELLAALVRGGVAVTRFSPVVGNLETVFMQLTEAASEVPTS